MILTEVFECDFHLDSPESAESKILKNLENQRECPTDIIINIAPDNEACVDIIIQNLSNSLKTKKGSLLEKNINRVIVKYNARSLLVYQS